VQPAELVSYGVKIRHVSTPVFLAHGSGSNTTRPAHISVYSCFAWFAGRCAAALPRTKLRAAAYQPRASHPCCDPRSHCVLVNAEQLGDLASPHSCGRIFARRGFGRLTISLRTLASNTTDHSAGWPCGAASSLLHQCADGIIRSGRQCERHSSVATSQAGQPTVRPPRDTGLSPQPLS
jgi:hypothetical protein